ncbi:MAG: RNA polymerase sporulation sigma factor SigH [Firmicutes bacterium]|nr:RNA polymerase sporulation sigma factor SigH [Bacillota bacterium]MBR1993604.1 RNA polymerase sporulation sigma factor SigH [Bacillota bacterium]
MTFENIFSDRDLVLKAQSGDLDAEETLMRKYKETVKIKAKMYYMAGADEDDVVQEGMIGLLKAIRQYDADKETSFGTFAGICITRQIISAIRSADRDKHKALNTSVSLSDPLKDESGEMTVEDTLRTNMAENPETLLVMKDIAGYILHNGDNILSDLEMEVLSEVLKGRSHEEIAEKLGKNSKSIDNALQRTKKKIVSYLWR